MGSESMESQEVHLGSTRMQCTRQRVDMASTGVFATHRMTTYVPVTVELLGLHHYDLLVAYGKDSP